MTDNKNLVEDVLNRIEKESGLYENVAQLSTEFQRSKTNQSNCLAISEDNKQTLEQLQVTLSENVKILNTNIEALTKRVSSL